MQKLNNVVIGFLLMGLLAQPVIAATDNQIQSLNSEELAFAFNDSNAGNLEVLSPEEMANTEGASFYLPWMTRSLHFFTRFASFGSAGIKAMWAFQKIRRNYPDHVVRIMRHGGHHKMSDGLYYRHWQITRYKPGRENKGSAVHDYFKYGQGSKTPFK